MIQRRGLRGARISEQKLIQKPSTAFYNFAKIIAESEVKDESDNETKKEYWIKMGNELETVGYPKEQISTAIRTAIEDELFKMEYQKLGVPREEVRYHSGFFYRVMRSVGWTDPFFSHSKDAPLGERENSSINTPKSEFEQENEPILNMLDRLKEFIDLAKLKLRNNHLLSVISEETKKAITEDLHLVNAHLQIGFDNYNEKQKIPANSQLMLLYCLATEASVNHGTAAYFEQYKKILDFTVKQATKYRKGQIPNNLSILKPKSRDIAIFLEYSGIQCKFCKSWCTFEKTDSGATTVITCFDCEKSFHAKEIVKCRYCQIPLYKEDLLHIVETGRCFNCNTENNLPQELIEYAKS